MQESSKKDALGVTKLSTDAIHLRFYTKRVCSFKVQDQPKRLEVIIFNQTYEPLSSLELLKTGGFGSLGLSWSAIFSIRGLSFIAFLTMCGLLVMSNVVCKDLLMEQEVA